MIVERCHNETNEIAECFAQDTRYIVVGCHLKSWNLPATTSAINRKFAYLAAALVLIKLSRFLWRSDCSILFLIGFVSTKSSICQRQTTWSAAFLSFRFRRIFDRETKEMHWLLTSLYFLRQFPFLLLLRWRGNFSSCSLLGQWWVLFDRLVILWLPFASFIDIAGWESMDYEEIEKVILFSTILKEWDSIRTLADILCQIY